jgi:hypothetical protein
MSSIANGNGMNLGGWREEGGKREAAVMQQKIRDDTHGVRQCKELKRCHCDLQSVNVTRPTPDNVYPIPSRSLAGRKSTIPVRTLQKAGDTCC